MALIEGVRNELQRTEEWYAEKLGRFSCSQFHRLMSEPKLKAEKEAGNLSSGALTYVYECAAEKLTGKKAKDDFTSKYTDWGIELEPIAKGIYNVLFETNIVDSEYITYFYNSGGSPDGLVGDDGLIEIKCPYTITSHLEHKLDDIPKEYYWQCLGYLLITDRQWIDFLSYQPDFPPKLQVVIKRIERKNVESDLILLETKLKKANEYLETILNSIQ
jgi:YqaJ-like viral recombinase domain